MKYNSLILTASVIILSACVTNTASVVQEKTSTANYTIKLAESVTVIFSNVRYVKRKSIYAVVGNVRLIPPHRHAHSSPHSYVHSDARRHGNHPVAELPGYITVTLKAADGSEVERVKAKSHIGHDEAVGHFDATLTNSLSEGGEIVVEHHQ